MSIERSNFPKLRLQYIPVRNSKKNVRNPRRHPQHQLDQLAKSVNTLGVYKPISVDEDLKVIYGNAVVMVAERLGITELPAVVIKPVEPPHFCRRKTLQQIGQHRLAYRHECAVDVDVAKMKFEVLAARAASHSLTLRDRLVGYLPRYAGLASRFAPLANLRNGSPLVAEAVRVLCLHQRTPGAPPARSPWAWARALCSSARRSRPI